MSLRAAALTLSLALALAGCQDVDNQSFQGWVEADLIFVSPDEVGRVETLSVREGDQVEAGAPLFTVDADLQKADLQMQEAALKNAQQAFDRSRDLVKKQADTQKNLDDAEAALRTAQARVISSRTRLDRRQVASPVTGSVEQIYFRVGETALPQIKLGDTVKVQCDGCAGDLVATVSFIARASEFTPPVIYSNEERAKLVFMVEARPQRPDQLRVGQPVSVVLAATPAQP